MRLLLTLLLTAAGIGCNCASRITTVTAQIAVTPTAIDFGTVPPLTSASASVKVTNTGRGILKIASQQITGPGAAVFSSLPLPATIAPEQSVGMSVFFMAPATGGPFTATLVIASNAVNAPQASVSLRADLVPTCLTTGCPDNATCETSDAGMPACACDPGYVSSGTGGALVCVSPCTLSNGGCDPHATCSTSGATVVCTCGQGYSGDGLTCAPLPNNAQISVGWFHACAIRPDDSLWCWGDNQWGEVGDGTVLERTVPTQVLPGTTWQSVVALGESACAVKTDGTLWCWGSNSVGQSGQPTTVGIVQAPTQVGMDTDWVRVTGGQYSTACGLKQDGSAWWWGAITMAPATGETNMPTPTQVMAPNGQPWTSLFCGTAAGCALQADESLWCWGLNNETQNLGLGTTSDTVLPITQVAGRGPFSSLALNGWAAFGIGTDHSLWTWGYQSYQDILAVPQRLDPTPQWSAIASAVVWEGEETVAPATCGIHVDGTLWCEGDNAYGNLASTLINYEPSFNQVGTATNWVAIAMGGATACAMDATDAISCWGLDDLGELGDGATPPYAPSQVAPGTTWKGVAPSNPNTPGFLGIRSDGTLWSWGQYRYLLESSGSDFMIGGGGSQVPVQVGSASTWESFGSVGTSQSCFLDASRSLWCGPSSNPWVPQGLSPPQPAPTQVGDAQWLTAASDGSATCGLQVDGTRWCWGANEGEFGNGSALDTSLMAPTQMDSRTWTSLALGTTYGCGVASGALFCWGQNDKGQLGLGTMSSSPVLTATQVGTRTDWASVSAAGQTTCALRTDGTLWCWGVDIEGELGDGGSATPAPTPTQIAGSYSTTAAIGAGSCALTTTGALTCWGMLPNGVGAGSQTAPPAPSGPTVLDSGSVWSSVAVVRSLPVPFLRNGLFWTPSIIAAIREDGTLWTWGADTNGARGDGRAWSATLTALTF
jgi:alpha-tubulin suppressor-like RCC1 family protein